MTVNKRAGTLLATIGLLALYACGGGGSGGGGGGNSNGGGSNGGTKSLTVTPHQVSVEPTQTVQLTATVTGIAVPKYTYELVPPSGLNTTSGGSTTGGTSSGGTLATLFGAVDTNGLFTAGTDVAPSQRGSIIVHETTSGLQFEVKLATVPAIQTITVTPDSAAVLAGQTQAFTATAIDFFSNPVSGFLVDWETSGGIGVVSDAGVFTGQTAGTGQVLANIGKAQPAAAAMTVVGSIVGLSITPVGNPVQVEAGTTRQFHALVRDGSGNQTQVTASWTVTPATLGTIDGNGNFVAAAAASGTSGTVGASAQGQTSSVPVSVVALITPPTERPHNLSGTVRQAGGALAAGATITAKLASDNSTVDSTTADANGQYSLFLPAGTYVISATLGGQTASQSNVSLPTQDARVTVNLTLVSS